MYQQCSVYKLAAAAAYTFNYVQLFRNPMDCSLSGSSVDGISQARLLEWVAISFSRGSSDVGMEPGSPALQADALPSEPPGKPDLNVLQT